MSVFAAKSICILGRQPAVGLAELESLYGAEHVMPGPMGAALLDIDGFEINFKNLGGTIKVARILADINSNNWAGCLDYLKESVPRNLNLEAGKFTLGVSLYGFDVTPGKLNADLLGLKKIVKATGKSVRLVPNNTLALSSAQVLHNKLTRLGSSELLLIKNGGQTILAQTLFVQDIEAYAARDQVRPARDARVGMLPPKLAQIIINLAVPAEERIKNQELRILDPFCGTGVILQEALLMGLEAIGTDLEPKMVQYSQENLDWLSARHEIPKYKLGQADATSFIWPNFDCVASELYLGRPLSSLPDPDKLNEIITGVNTITKKFLTNLAPQLKSASRICLAVPAWRAKNGFKHLPLIDHLTDMGYNRYDFVHLKNDELIYFRENQIVARELLILTRI